MRMVRLSGQQGVPVITVNDQVVVGFDRRRLEQLLSQASTSRVHLGAAVADAAPRLHVEGAYVGRVKPGSPAERAGLRVADIIVALDGRTVHSASDLEQITADLRPGMCVRFTYLRGGNEIMGEARV